MTGLREKMLHAEYGLDLEAIWNIAIEDVSSLKPLILRMLKTSQN